MEYDATFFAFVGLVIFLALVAYLKVPGMMAKSLDERAENIREELAEAKRLREEAQALLADYQKKSKEAEAEAAAIVAVAQREAAALAADAKAKTEEFVARRNAISEQKIKQAETDAVNAVRAAAVDLATAAAQTVLAKQSDADLQARLFKAGVSDVKTRLN
ncbi:F0F1 ATP synthase subunit B [Allorhizobium terrae]|uniref:ATP synthase subunit b n=1 Tax=Allorhizobium terrae TaxID=1848972 RepID=A0A4S3ZYB3_9HYPH|nr:F0F1 ATP synthase subunit B [Allorhizobium terrae]THF50920.1 F0F1 ATP synthase subunit B [Allorhizobium terrae]TWD55303.1 F-type H+-transporting ATPase subunit b [Agrobacterium vitis]